MRSVLVDLILESEAATALALRLARAFESDAPSEAALRRALTSGAKFWVCKRGCELAAEAMEILGGNGYTEELSLARMLREMPVNSIWEGSGNIMCLDVLRAFGKVRRDQRGRAARAVDGARPEPLFRCRVRALRRIPCRRIRAKRSHVASCKDSSRSCRRNCCSARRTGSRRRALVAEAFCATRLNPEAGWGAVFGAAGALSDAGVLLDRAFKD